MGHFKITAIIIFCATVSCELEPGFRATYGDGHGHCSRGKNYFFKLPLYIDAAVANDWVPMERPPGPLPSLVMYCSQELVVCVLYDPFSKFAAGVQIALNKKKFENAVFDWDVQGFVPWTPSVAECEEPGTYMTKVLLFISEETLKKSKRKRNRISKSNGVLLEDSVWVTGFNRKLVRISKKESNVAKTIFTKQGCYPAMGQHYFYNMSSTTPCTSSTIFNWFPIFNDGKLIAVGFLGIGGLDQSDAQRNWVETPSEDMTQAIVPDGPECINDFKNISTCHFYFVDKPWKIECNE